MTTHTDLEATTMQMVGELDTGLEILAEELRIGQFMEARKTVRALRLITRGLDKGVAQMVRECHHPGGPEC